MTATATASAAGWQIAVRDPRAVTPDDKRLDPRKPRENPVAVYRARLGKRTRRVALQALNRVAALCTDGQADAYMYPWHRLRYADMAALRAALQDPDRMGRKLSVGTINRLLSAVRAVIKEAWRLGYLSAEDYHRTVDVKNVEGTTLPKGRGLSPGEFTALVAVCQGDTGPAGARDLAILAVLYGAGIRRQEAVNLQLGDYREDPDNGVGIVTVREGKRNKDRISYVDNGAKRALDDWIAMRGDWEGPLLCACTKGRGGAIMRSGISPQAIFAMLLRRAHQAGVERFTPHDLRRSFISDLLDNGQDIVSVQHLVGHASPSTTARYDRRGERAKIKAIKGLCFPYTGTAVPTAKT